MYNPNNKAKSEAVKRREKFIKSVLAALVTKPRPMREIAAKLGLADASGAVKPSNAAKIRIVLKGLIESGDVERVGETLKTTAYRKVKK
jgi:hypothetical protein